MLLPPYSSGLIRSNAVATGGNAHEEERIFFYPFPIFIMERTTLPLRYFFSCVSITLLVIAGMHFTRSNVAYSQYTEIICNDDIDNDEDLLIDCTDNDCAMDGACRELICDDSIDNDEDTMTDCSDTDCHQNPACIHETDCTNDEDDDEDLLIDCADNDCATDTACQSSSSSSGQ